MMPRKSPRLRLSGDVDIRFMERIVHGLLQDISMSGMFIKSIAPLRVGDNPLVTLHLPVGARLMNLDVRSVVVRVAPEGAAFRFSNIDYAAFEPLRAIFQNKSALSRLTS